MALLFDAATEQVDHGSDASLDNLVPCTYAVWIYPDTINTSNRKIISKRVNGSNSFEWTVTDVFDGSRPESINAGWAHSGGGGNSASVANVLTVGAWNFEAVTFDGTNAPRLWHGDLSTIVSEVSYFSQNAPSGGLGDDSSASFVVGRRGITTNFLGRIAWLGAWGAELTLGQLKALQFRPRLFEGNCKLFVHYGPGAVDLSGLGSNGTITGATVADHVPLGPRFGFDLARPNWAALPFFENRHAIEQGMKPLPAAGMGGVLVQ